MDLLNISLDSFSKKEQIIIEYIKNNPISVQSMNIHELAKVTNSSSSSISKLAKKLGYSGFSKLKIEIAKNTTSPTLDHQIYENDSFEKISQKISSVINTSTQQTIGMIDANDIKKIVEKIKSANKIYLFGVSASGIVCSDFYYKLSRIGKHVIYNQDAHTQLASVIAIKDDDIAIGISYSGETKEVYEALAFAKLKNAFTCAISASGKSKLTRYTDVHFKLPRYEQTIRVGAITSRNNSLLITDLIYLALVQGNNKNVLKLLEETRLITQKLK